MAASFTLLVAAIDFGTTFSSWGYSFRHEFEKEPTKVFTQIWHGGHLSPKAPTAILIEPDGRTLHSFGYDAERKYISLIEEKEQEPWYYFERFKMKLYDQKRLGRDMMLEDTSGKKSLPAKTVISLLIQYMKDDLMTMIQTRIFGCGTKEDDVHWVLTVPAIWNDAAKQFMREAAHEAGISYEKISIALEPEVASVYCRHDSIERISSENTAVSKFLPGKRYIVLDAGGETVDITVHEVLRERKLKELYTASVGNCGGTRVDEAFFDFLIDLVGSGVMSKFKERHTDDYIEFLRDFEERKRSILAGSDAKVSLKIPNTFTELVEELRNETLQGVIDDTIYSRHVSLLQFKLRGTKLQMDSRIVKTFFDRSIMKIVEQVKAALKQPANNGIYTLIMVGGFSESTILQEAMKSNFPGIRVIVPNEAGLVILKGSVIFGHSPLTLSARVERIFDPDLHSVKKEITICYFNFVLIEILILSFVIIFF